MNIGDFLSALVDDIVGKDANGRSADEKRAYVVTLIWVLFAGTIGLLFVWPPAAIVTLVIMIWKIKIHLTNTY